jgi:hypothetical protein
MLRPSLTNLETLCWLARPWDLHGRGRINTTQPAVSNWVKELEQAPDAWRKCVAPMAAHMRCKATV